MDVYLSKKQSIPQTTWIVPFLFIAFTSLFGEGLTWLSPWNMRKHKDPFFIFHPQQSTLIATLHSPLCSTTGSKVAKPMAPCVHRWNSRATPKLIIVYNCCIATVTVHSRIITSKNWFVSCLLLNLLKRWNITTKVYLLYQRLNPS